MVWLQLLAAATVSAPPAVVVTIHGTIETSLGKAVGDDAAALGNQVARLIRWRGDINRNVQPSDTLRLLFERAPEPELVAMIYEGAEINLKGYRFKDTDGIERFYDEGGTLIEPKILHPPVDGYVQITEVVQSGRGKRKHKGLDLKAPEGAPIILPFDAVVARVNWGSVRVNGKCVEVVYPNGHVGRFLHFSEVEPDIVAGAKLKAGTRLGAVGSTGHSIAPHLHYEVRAPNGDALDPLVEHGVEKGHVSEGQKAAFDAARLELNRRLGVAGSTDR